jgi:hypothetical protein
VRYYLSTGVSEEKAKRLATRFSRQSGRVGFVIAAKEAGAADTAIAATTRHKSLQMIKRYGRPAQVCAPSIEGCWAMNIQPRWAGSAIGGDGPGGGLKPR